MAKSPLDRVLRDMRLLTPGERDYVLGNPPFTKSSPVKQIEEKFGIGIDVVSRAIERASSLTLRGFRGVIGETVFATEIAPNMAGWSVEDFEGDLPYDVILRNGEQRIRIQVKMQRRVRNEAWVYKKKNLQNEMFYAVEVQKTRGGKDVFGQATRPYSFADFDILAICMQASEADWRKFLYVRSKDLIPYPGQQNRIKTIQPVPVYPGDGEVYTNQLSAAIWRFVSDRPSKNIELGQSELFSNESGKIGGAID